MHVCALSCSAVSDSLWPYRLSLLGSSVHGILQTRILEWVSISSSRGSSRHRDQTNISCDSCIGRQILNHWATYGYHQKNQHVNYWSPRRRSEKNGAERSSEELIAGKLPNLGRHFDIQACRAQRPPNRPKNGILYWVSYISPRLCGQLLEDYCDPSMLSFFLWFFMFSEDLYCYLHICSSSYLRQSLLTDFKGEILSITLARDSETFLDFSPDSPVPCFLLYTGAELLSLCAFSGSCNSPVWILAISLLFSQI